MHLPLFALLLTLPVQEDTKKIKVADGKTEGVLYGWDAPQGRRPLLRRAGGRLRDIQEARAHGEACRRRAARVESVKLKK